MSTKMKQVRKPDQRLITVCMLAGLLVGVAPALAEGESLTFHAKPSSDVQQLRIPTGKSAIIDLPVTIKRASLANPDVADAIVLSPKQIYVTGKGYGTTNLTLWGKDEQVFAVFDVEVGFDISRLRSRLQMLLPDEDGIRLMATNDHVTLSGSVSSSTRLNQVAALAEAYAPKKVLNFLKVHPEPREDVPASVSVEVIRGTTVDRVTPK